MDRATLIDSFNAHANAALAAGTGLDAGQLAVWRESDAGLVERMVATFEEALRPAQVEMLRLTEPDARLEQAYALLETTFSPDVLSSREGFIRKLASRDPNAMLYGRYWRVSGDHSYNAAGELTRFRFDPLAATEGAASFIDAAYMPLGDGRAIVAIGYLVTRLAMRRGQGHGSALVTLLEAEAEAHARSRGETLSMILLESESDARPFWFRRGYRWPQGAVYLQPPIAVDEARGVPLSPPVPETLMVRVPAAPEATHVERDALLAMVRHLYAQWYGVEGDGPAAEQYNRYLFGDLFQQLIDSLPEAQVPLVEPPLT